MTNTIAPSSDSADDESLDRLIADYLAAYERGDNPDIESFVKKRPEFSKQLRQFARDYEQATAFFSNENDGTSDPEKTPAFVPAAPASFASLQKGAIIAGRYKLLEPIGEGGMGMVYMAQQINEIKRLVAIKIIRPDLDGKRIIARFEAERQALALMDHPNIAKVFDSGTTESQRPYYVMELVKGVPLNRYCDSHKLTIEQRLRLFVPICKGVQHAHQKGVIHRDLKPSNILVEEHDGEPVPKIIDFGLAKPTSGLPLTDKTLVTEFGQIVGTYLYMPPEQAVFNALDIDTRADVYSLGVILYELLTGSTPIDRTEIAEIALAELLRRVREHEPPRPSERLSKSASLPNVAAVRSVEPQRLSGILRGDLDWIVMKSLEKERKRRYDGPGEIAAELERYLNREPVLAVPPSLTYRWQKFLRKHWRGTVVAAMFLVMLVSTLIGGVWLELGRRDAKAQVAVVESKKIAAEAKISVAESEKLAAEAREQLSLQKAEATKREAEATEYIGLMGKVSKEEAFRAPGWTERAAEHLQRIRALQTGLKNSVEIRSLWAEVIMAAEYNSKPDWRYPDRIRAIVFSPDGKCVAVAPYSDYLNSKPRIIFYKADTGEEIRRIECADNTPTQKYILRKTVRALHSRFEGLHFLDNSRVIGWTSWGRLYQLDFNANETVKRELDLGADCLSVIVTADSKYVLRVAGDEDSSDRKLRCWDAQTFEPMSDEVVEPIRVDAGNSVVWGGDSVYFVAKNKHHRLSLPQLQSVEFASTFPLNSIYHPSGKFFVSNHDQSFRAYSSPDGVLLYNYDSLFYDHHSKNLAATDSYVNGQFSRMGNCFGAQCDSSRGHEVRIFDAFGGQPVAVLPFPVGQIPKWNGFALSSDGARVATISDQGWAVFSLNDNRRYSFRTPGHPHGLRLARLSPTHKQIVVLGDHPRQGGDYLSLWRPETVLNELNSENRILMSVPSRIWEPVAFSPDERWVAIAHADDEASLKLSLIDTNRSSIEQSIKISSAKAAFGKPSFDSHLVGGINWLGNRTLVAAIDRELLAWDVSDEPPKQIANYWLSSLVKVPPRFSGLATIKSDIWAINTASGLYKAKIVKNSFEIQSNFTIPGFSNCRICRPDPSEKYLAIGKSDGSIVIFDLQKEAFSPPADSIHLDSVQAMAWLSDSRLATGSRDGSVAIWRIDEAGALELVLRLNLRKPIADMTYAHGLRGIYVACMDETSLRYFDLQLLDHSLRELCPQDHTSLLSQN